MSRKEAIASWKRLSALFVAALVALLALLAGPAIGGFHSR